ncbi:MAG: hypothetical protein GXO92_07595, partial [FCB group bacterium]|nr:hypothetical protein [FCB group bacterium]
YDFSNPSFADNGKKIVCWGFDSERFGVFAVETESNNVRWLAYGKNPVVSPDGQRVLFRTKYAVKDSSGLENIYPALASMSVDGSDYEIITYHPKDSISISVIRGKYSPGRMKQKLPITQVDISRSMPGTTRPSIV